MVIGLKPFSGIKQPGLEADHSSLSIAEVKEVELYLHSLIRLHGVMWRNALLTL
jgi:hypothetical protein